LAGRALELIPGLAMMFDELKFQQLLSSNSFGRHFSSMESVTSTNDELRNWSRAEKLPEGTVVLAEHQSAGRGRRGLPWYSSKGSNLTFSILLFPSRPVHQLGMISLIAGVAIAKALQSAQIENVQLKWPNDIVMHGMKCGGILMESFIISGQPSVIAGIGLNVNETASGLKDEIQASATSLLIETKLNWSREDLLCRILQRLEAQYDVHDEETISDWKSICGHLNKSVNFHSGNKLVKGIFTDITSDGFALIEVDGNQQEFSHGVITI